MTATSSSPGSHRVLVITAVAEAVSLLILLINLATAHVPAIATAVGPIHGTVYLLTIVLAWTGGHPRRIGLLALIPGIGGRLALRATADQRS